MAKCKNCGTQLDNNATVCHVCGQINPIKMKKMKTVDITTKFDQEKVEYLDYQPRSRKIAVTLFMLVGFTGAPYFYLADRAKAFISILSTLVVILSAILLGLFVFNNVLIPVIVAIVLIYAINIIIGLTYLTKHEIKDGQGEFLV